MINFRPADITPHQHSEPFVDPFANGRMAAAAQTQCHSPDGNSAAAVLSSRGLSDILRERLRQVEDLGHTPEADALVPLTTFQIVVMRIAHGVTRTGGLDDRAKLRKKLVSLAAYCLAFIDRIDGAQTSTSETPQ